MKNKPTRHKESNTFKFKPFSERIADIDVDVFHRVTHRNEDESDETETHFHLALQKWSVLNLTENYTNLKKEVRGIVTLPQLLNSKNQVIVALLKYLNLKDTLCLQPILELVVAAARDLQKEFYEYFPQFLTIIIDLLHTNDAEQLEFTFTALAYLFKFLWRYLIKNVDTVFDLLLPLLAESKPTYVNNFAAESFSFVVRKVKDKDAFLKLLLNALAERSDGVSGCGKLLFEVIQGTPGQFHSCAEQMLTLYMGSLQNEAIDQQLLHSVVRQVVNSFLNSIHPQNSEIFWTVSLRLMDQFMESYKKLDKTVVDSTIVNCNNGIVLLQSLLLEVVTYKDGKMVVKHNSLINQLVKSLDFFENSEVSEQSHKLIIQGLAKLSGSVLLASNVKLTQESSNKLVLKILSISDAEILYSVVEQLIYYSSFETLILPQFMNYSFKTCFNHNILRIFARIILAKSPPCLNGIKLKEWIRYNLNVKNIPNDSLKYLQNELSTLTENSVSKTALQVLLILPHLNPIPNICKQTLLRDIVLIYQKLVTLGTDNSHQKPNTLGFTFLVAIESVIHILEPDEFYELIMKHDINLSKLINIYSSDRSILGAVDLCLTNILRSELKKNIVNIQLFDTIDENLAPVLASPYHKDRLVVAHIYSLFSHLKDFLPPIDVDAKNPLELPYLAETEPATVHSYRERLLQLQGLAFESYTLINLDPKYLKFPLYYLLGNLYINFSLLWDPTIKLIASYAHKRCESFWPIFMSKLESGKTPENTTAGDDLPTFDCDVTATLLSKVYDNNDKPDRVNYNLLLWKCMALFSDFCEMKNRDLTGFFIDFVESNFFKSNSEDAKSWSIKKHDKDDEPITQRTQDEDQDELNSENTSQNDSVAKKILFDGKHNVKLLLTQLEIFSKMKNPRTLYREAEMYKIYLELLSSRNAEVQKSALNCLVTYKHKYLLPYKEHLYNIIDEKSLKNELALFKIDRDSKMIQDDHREGLLPIVMRIVYAKMVMRTGIRTGGKAGGLVRRTIVLRFLAGSQEDEMMIFISMAFKLFHQYVPIMSDQPLDLNEMAKDVIANLDLSNIIPPKRLQSSVNLLAIIIEQFGGKMSSKLLPRLLGIVICVLAKVTAISQRSNDVHPGYLSSIRNLRSSCLGILARFFSHYENYAWTESEVDALFAVAVFPWLEKLPMEGIYSPTALLKLFIAWSQNPRYYPLFAKHHESNSALTPLGYIIQLLLGPKTHASVINAIMEMIEKLLTLQDYGATDNSADQMELETTVVPIDLVKNMLQVKQNAIGHTTNNINYGSALLLTHIPSVLEYIKRKLSKKTTKGVNRLELSVLSRVSEFVTDSETCDTLLTLLLPILVKKATTGATEEFVIQLVSTILNLTKIVKQPEKHIRLIVPLVGAITAVSARKSLMQLYNVISKGSKEEHREIMIRNCKLLAELNAWDSKWIDQPDFERRLDAFKAVDTLLDEDALSLEFGAAIIYNCFFFLKTEKDLALRDVSGQCLKSVAPKLVRKYDSHADKHYLIDDTILTIVRAGIRDKNETVRNQSISLLGLLAMECSEFHPVFRDLYPLTNEADPEVDVFENLQHLQLHRKARALLKFCAVAKVLKRPPNPKTLTQFILPLTSSYLCSENFINKNSIVDAAIETVGTVCRLLPWHQYEVILKYYLDKLRTSLEFQKQTIRIVVAILDAFHYNLSKYKESPAISTAVTVVENESKQQETSVDNDEDSIENVIADPEEQLDQALADVTANPDEYELKDAKDSKADVPAMDRELVLSQSAARRLVFSISKSLLPQLHRSIMARTQHENSHKVNRKKTGFEREEEEILRVPIALAVVKLLQKLPEGVLEQNLPGVLMKLCTFLKSRLDSVRRITRETMQKIMITLGPAYLHHLLTEMNSLLTKGFQVHVLVYTIHAVLVSLKPFYKPLHINNNLQSILAVCKVDLFGLTAEEKEISGIVKNVSEAKSTKSFDIFHILAQFITESCLLDLVMPLKDALLTTHSYKIIRKAVECLRQIVLGLADNSFIETNQMLVFLYGVVSESIPDLLPTTKPKPISEKEAEIKSRQKPDCFIVAREPKNRMGIKARAKTSSNTNAHVMVEFGLRLYHILLKRDRILSPEFKSYLDPVVSILNDCLKSQHVKLTTLALQCLNWILKTDLPSVKIFINEICSSMFNILHKYAAAGLSKGDNFDLVMAAFKCMSVLVRDVKHFTINAEQLKILIIYAEQDLHDYDKQGTAFTLLRAILSRKLIVPEMHQVMERVAKLSVTSDLDHVRQQARSLFHVFLMEYPLGKALERHLSFYLSQLNYELKPGRQSALEMIHGIITGFPLTILSQHSGLLFLMVGARLVNDDDPECKKLCAKCVKEMIARLPHNDKKKLFDIVLLWLKDVKISHRRLAAQLCGIFITVEKEEFESHLTELLPLILKQFNADDSEDSAPGRFVRLKKDPEIDARLDDEKFESLERMKDHHLFQILQMLLKLAANCPTFLTNEKYEETICTLAAYSQSLLAHPHLWVRLAAAQLIGFILAAIDTEKVAEILENPDKTSTCKGFIYADPFPTIKSLTLDLAAQLQPDFVFEDLVDQVVKNLVFVARVVKSVGHKDEKKSNDYKNEEHDIDRISLFWLVKRMRKVVNIEVTQSPKSTTMRTAVFKWIAGVVATVPVKNLMPVLFHMMSPLVREMSTTEEVNAPLRHLAKDVATMIKKSVGNEEYARLLSKVQQKLDTKRAEKKKLRTQEFVTEPELAAKRKIAKQQKKKEAKKRKMESMKGRKTVGKRLRKEVNFDEM